MIKKSIIIISIILIVVISVLSATMIWASCPLIPVKITMYSNRYIAEIDEGGILHFENKWFRESKDVELSLSERFRVKVITQMIAKNDMDVADLNTLYDIRVEIDGKTHSGTIHNADFSYWQFFKEATVSTWIGIQDMRKYYNISLGETLRYVESSIKRYNEMFYTSINPGLTEMSRFLIVMINENLENNILNSPI